MTRLDRLNEMQTIALELKKRAVKLDAEEQDDIDEADAPAADDEQHPYDVGLNQMADAVGADEDPDDDEEDNVKKATAHTSVVTRPPAPLRHHKFETVVSRIHHARGVPMTEAARLARVENVDLYNDYQGKGELHGNGEGQQLVIDSPGTMVKASASFEHAVQLEQQQFGISHEAAAQRVCEANPDLAREHIAKSTGGPVARYMQLVDEIKKRDNCERHLAMSRARREFPDDTYAAFENV